ncbi:MAG TPA: polysaccharide biosynthesis/export family protein [Terriglobia bacterium]|nr:polysaccharide biosynthesis/export family protein [Terriglobia bacterium]
MKLRTWLLSTVICAFLCWNGVPALQGSQSTAPSQEPQQPEQPSQTTQQPSKPPVTQPSQPDVQPPVDQSAPENVTPTATPDASATGPEGDNSTVNPAAFGPADPGNLANGRIGPNYLLGPEDEVEINVFDVPELSKFDAQVGNDGTISVPLIGSVRAAGLTQRQVRAELTEKLGEKYLNNPQVTLFIKSFKSRPVSVVGSVTKPGEYYLTGYRNLVDVIAMAGGLASIGAQAGKYVYVERKEGFQDLPQVDGLVPTAPDKVSIELHKLLYSQDSRLNIEIHPFDVVTVSRAGIVYLVGAFVKPGGYVLENKDSMTAMEGIALAQGIGGNARTSQGMIIHRSLSGTVTSEVPIDVKKLMHGKIPDVTLADNDIFFLPNSTAKSITKGAAGNVVGILTGIAIYRGL